MVGTVIFAIAVVKLLATKRNSLKPVVSYCLSQEVVGGLEDFLVKQEEVGEQTEPEPEQVSREVQVGKICIQESQ